MADLWQLSRHARRGRPGLADAYRLLGIYLALAGRSDEAIANLEKSMQLSPQDLWVHECFYGMAMAHVAAGRYEKQKIGHSVCASGSLSTRPPT